MPKRRKPISSSDIKKLWGRAAGRCSHPECGIDCVPLLDPKSGPITLGEMAHVIPHSPNGPRGTGKPGAGTYENLILLCPTHHTQVDEASGAHPAALLLTWKKDHEERIRESLAVHQFKTKRDLFQHINFMLIENHAVWKALGPESDTAKTNPLSNSAELWTLRKLSKIVPNNRRIINLITSHCNFFSADEYEYACQFIEHAEGFEQNCYETIEGVPRFPLRFKTMIQNHVSI
jgi:hypothetical protein